MSDRLLLVHHVHTMERPFLLGHNNEIPQPSQHIACYQISQVSFPIQGSPNTGDIQPSRHWTHIKLLPVEYSLNGILIAVARDDAVTDYVYDELDFGDSTGEELACCGEDVPCLITPIYQQGSVCIWDMIAEV